MALTLPGTELADLSAPLSADVISGEAGRLAWLAFEPSAVLTPYQSHAWLDGVCRAYGWAEDAIHFLRIHRGQHLLAMLPIRVHHSAGVGLAEIPGSGIGNSDWLPVAAGNRLDADEIRKALAVLPRATGADIIRFSYLPASWRGVANPLLTLPATVSPDPLYISDLDAGTKDKLPKRRRVDITRGRRRLEEMFGPVTLRPARTAAEIDTVHAAFLEQRGARFQQMGIANVFGAAHFTRLFRDLGTASLDQCHPTLRFHALYGGETLLATAIGVQSHGHYSQYINSHVEGAAAKYSLVGLLMLLLVDDLAAEGITSIDMGVGEFAYKENWTARQTVFDLVLPLTIKGRIAAPAFAARRAVKRFIKQNQGLWRLSKQVRSLSRRLHRS